MRKLESMSLWSGVAIPFIYFCSVALGALFHPRFSFVHQFASELGAAETPRPQILNIGLMLLGCASLAAVFGFWRALQHAGANPIPARWTCLVLPGFAVAMFMAGLFPMPNIRHFGFGLSFLLLGGPLVLAAALSNRIETKSLRRFLIVTNILIVVMYDSAAPDSSRDKRFFPPNGSHATPSSVRVPNRRGTVRTITFSRSPRGPRPSSRCRR
jgi:hypothetical membrane protein